MSYTSGQVNEKHISKKRKLLSEKLKAKNDKGKLKLLTLGLMKIHPRDIASKAKASS